MCDSVDEEVVGKTSKKDAHTRRREVRAHLESGVWEMIRRCPSILLVGIQGTAVVVRAAGSERVLRDAAVDGVGDILLAAQRAAKVLDVK